MYDAEVQHCRLKTHLFFPVGNGLRIIAEKDGRAGDARVNGVVIVEKDGRAGDARRCGGGVEGGRIATISVAGLEASA